MTIEPSGIHSFEWVISLLFFCQSWILIIYLLYIIQNYAQISHATFA